MVWITLVYVVGLAIALLSRWRIGDTMVQEGWVVAFFWLLSPAMVPAYLILAAIHGLGRLFRDASC